MHPALRQICLLGTLCASVLAGRAADPDLIAAGVARTNITPTYPIRLSGYAARKSESQGTAQSLWAKAIALGADGEKPAILITVDNCGVPGTVREEVARRLRRDRRIAPERIAVCSTHTHSAPQLKGYLPNLFLQPLTGAELEHIDRYTRELTDALEGVALAAMADRKPARLSWGEGTADFAANRRTKGGPVDHDLPVLALHSPKGELRAVFANYACHGTTLTGEFNQVCGDWPGYAAECLEAEHPGVVALVALGCAGDANPEPRSSFDLARAHGREFATAVDSVLTTPRTPLTAGPACRTREIKLPFDQLPTRAQWQALAKQTNYAGLHARRNLERLDRKERLPESLAYRPQVWAFGHGLTMVFLPGEVVVDYSLRLKRELDHSRLWVNAYANDMPCYIPSDRVLAEGGYEGGGAMVYYDQPTRFARGVEDRIIRTVRDLTPREFRNPDH